jgi:hypothetical protein
MGCITVVAPPVPRSTGHPSCCATVGVILALALAAALIGSPAAAQDVGDPRSAAGRGQTEDHTVVFEIGFAADAERGEHVQRGVTVAFEITPIERWLELEIGISRLGAAGAVEMPIDVLVKKPWQPTPRFEFMIGAGPEIIHASGADTRTFWGVEGVLDFMFWPKKNVGWYAEPGYELTFHDGSEHRSLGVAIGILIGR